MKSTSSCRTESIGLNFAELCFTLKHKTIQNDGIITAITTHPPCPGAYFLCQKKHFDSLQRKF